MSPEPHAPGARRARGFPALLGAAGVAVAFHAVAPGIEASVLVLVSIAWVAWMSGRPAGIGLALASGLLHLVRYDFHASYGAVLVVGLWLATYLGLAVTVSAIEIATRPKT